VFRPATPVQQRWSETQRVALGDLFEDVARPAAGVHEVFGDDLEPVHGRPLVEDVGEVDGAQADAQAEVGVSEAGGDHQSVLREPL